MNITLRCQGSKREQARPPMCAARRRAHRRAVCRGDRTNAALNARVRANRPQGYSCRGSYFCRPYRAGALPTRRAAGHFFSVSRASWTSTTSPSTRPFLLSRTDAVEQKPWAQWSPPVPVSQCMIHSAFLKCIVGRWHAIVISSRSRIGVTRSVLSTSVSRQAQASRPPKSSRGISS